MDYPYYKNYITKKELLQDFKEFKKSSLKHLDMKKRNCLLHLEAETNNFFKITDYFSEECRVKCSFRNYLPPIEKFQKIKHKIPKTNNYWVIEQYLYIHARGCNNYNIQIVLELLRYLKPKRMLDFSSGWGDRLIGSIAYGCEYQGVDPSECMHSKYLEIIETLVPKNKRKNYNVQKIGFENFKVEKENYDLVFTSPPFFDLEIYENLDTQSIQKFNTFNKWKYNFLFVSIKKSFESLRKGGFLALYIEDYKKENGKKISYVRDTQHFIFGLGMKYMGYICTSNKGDENNIRKIYVWKKE